MPATDYIVHGYAVPQSDLILTLEVFPDRDLESFWAPNRCRIAHNAKKDALERRVRAGTAEIETCIVVLTFSNPPAQSRSHFVIGRDPRACDIVCPRPRVNAMHLKIGFDVNHTVLYNVSHSGANSL